MFRNYNNRVKLINDSIIRKRDYDENTKYRTVRQGIYMEG